MIAQLDLFGMEAPVMDEPQTFFDGRYYSYDVQIDKIVVIHRRTKARRTLKLRGLRYGNPLANVTIRMRRSLTTQDTRYIPKRFFAEFMSEDTLRGEYKVLKGYE